MSKVYSRPIIRDPKGKVTNTSSLPKDSNVRWTPNNKTRVIRAVAAGLISIDEAVIRYNLSHEEFEGWKKALAENGASGLKVTKRNK